MTTNREAQAAPTPPELPDLPVVAWASHDVDGRVVQATTDKRWSRKWRAAGGNVRELTYLAEASTQIAELTADRDSWSEQASQRLADWDAMRQRAEAAEQQVQEMREAAERALAALQAVTSTHMWPRTHKAAIDGLCAALAQGEQR